jgi:hypothetical protein
MNRLPVNPPEGNRPRRLVVRERQIAPPLALPSLPRLTTRLALARPLSRTDILRRATLDPDWRR